MHLITIYTRTTESLDHTFVSKEAGTMTSVEHKGDEAWCGQIGACIPAG